MLALFCVLGIEIGIGKWIRSPLFTICEAKVMSTDKLTFTVSIEEHDDSSDWRHARGVIDATGGSWWPLSKIEAVEAMASLCGVFCRGDGYMSNHPVTMT